MKREAVYEAWRGEAHPWVAWVKAPLFERVADNSLAVADGGAAYRAETPPWAALDTSWLPESGAVLIDLPGEAAVSLALAAGHRGVRPVLSINACSEPGELISMQAVIDLLSVGARFTGAFPTGPRVAPAFVLDSRRNGAGLAPSPGSFDNRWAVFGSDLPSAAELRNAGLTRVLLVQRGSAPLGDVEAILRTYQAGGLELLLHDVTASAAIVPLTLVERGWFAAVWESVRRRLSVRRRWDGSFGRRVPIPPAPSHG